MALGWATFFIGILALLAGALHTLTGGAATVAARATAMGLLDDIAFSALAEGVATLEDALRKGRPIGAIDVRQALADGYPFAPFDLEAIATFGLVMGPERRLRVSPVTVSAVWRAAPGEEDPLRGVVDLRVRVRERLGGAGRTVKKRYLFTVPCSMRIIPSDEGSYRAMHWGLPRIHAHAVATVLEE